MICEGRDVIIITRDDAQKLLDAIRLNWDKKKIKNLQKQRLLNAINELRIVLKEKEESNG